MQPVSLRGNEKLLILPDAAAATHVAAQQVVASLSESPHPQSVALSGGRTPAEMFRLLTQPPLQDRVDWKKIEWFWSDERCVPPDHADSNFRMADETLLKPLKVSPERIHRMPADAADLDAADREYENSIRKIVLHSDDGVPVFDLILLGIGSDGHTASLFPGSSGLDERDRLVISHFAPAPKAMRMTMTFPLLQEAANLVILACGPDKAEAFKRIFVGPADEAPPAARLRESQGQIVWIIDRAAASLLPASSL